MERGVVPKPSGGLASHRLTTGQEHPIARHSASLPGATSFFPFGGVGGGSAATLPGLEPVGISPTTSASGEPVMASSFPGHYVLPAAASSGKPPINIKRTLPGVDGRENEQVNEATAAVRGLRRRKNVATKAAAKNTVVLDVLDSAEGTLASTDRGIALVRGAAKNSSGPAQVGSPASALLPGASAKCADGAVVGPAQQGEVPPSLALAAFMKRQEAAIKTLSSNVLEVLAESRAVRANQAVGLAKSEEDIVVAEQLAESHKDMTASMVARGGIRSLVDSAPEPPRASVPPGSDAASAFPTAPWAAQVKVSGLFLRMGRGPVEQIRAVVI